MFNNKKGNILRHPYATLMVIGLATAGAITIGDKIRCMFRGGSHSISNMIKGMKPDSDMMNIDR